MILQKEAVVEEKYFPNDKGTRLLLWIMAGKSYD